MVSNARLDLPEPESPVTTMSLSRGISTEMFLRLCTRAPWTATVVRAVARETLRLGAERFLGILSRPFTLFRESELTETNHRDTEAQRNAQRDERNNRNPLLIFLCAFLCASVS